MTERDAHDFLLPGDDRNALDDRVGDLVAEYLDRLNDGERIDSEDIIQTHPDLGETVLEELETFVDLATNDNESADVPLGVLGDYTLRRQIGRGGMGVVYEAWEASMDRLVALKVLPVGAAADDKTFNRFMREARTAGKLSHPHVVPVFGVGIKEQTPYYAMEYVEGETLGQVLREIREAAPDAETPFGPKDQADYYIRLARAFADVADGLQHAHSKGVIHRDIKPSNLILDRERRLRILDFGLAHLEGQESLTLSGDVVGTPSYMSPEQAQAKKDPIDHRTDVYSLGATMYQALTLRPPFRGKSHQDTLSQIIERDPAEPTRSNPRIPADFETVILKCLRKDPADRYGTAEALAQDLRRFVRGDAVEARPEARWEKLARRVWRQRLRIGSVVALVVSIVAVALLLESYSGRLNERKRAEYRETVVTAVSKLQLSQSLGEFEKTRLSRRDQFSAHLLDEVLFAENLALTERIRRALEELEEAIAFLPDQPEAHYFRAHGLLSLGKEEDALRELGTALEIRPDFLPARVFKAAIHKRRNESALAESELAAARNKNRNFADSWFQAQTAAAARDWQEAEGAFTEVLDSLRGESDEEYLGMEAEIRLGRGMVRAELGQYRGAVRDFYAAHLGFPTALEPGLLLGYSYLLAGAAENRTIADRWFREFSDALARKDGSLRDEAAFGIATMYTEWGDSGRALTWLETLKDSELKDRAQIICLLSGIIFGDDQAIDQAIELAKRLSEEEARDPLTIALLGFTWSHALGKASETRDLLEQATAKGPDDSRVQNLASAAYFNLGDWKRAIAHGREATRLDPESFAARDQLGVALYRAGGYEEALEVYLACLEDFPTSIQVHNRLGATCGALKKFDVAENHLEQALALCEEQSPDNWLCAHVLDAYGDLKMETKEMQAAEDLYRRSIAVSARFPNPYYSLATLRTRQKRWDEALAFRCEGLLLEYALNFIVAHCPQLAKILREHAEEIERRDSLDRLVPFFHRFMGKADGAYPAKIHDAFALVLLYAPTLGDLERALDNARRAVSISDEKKPRFLATLAIVEFEAGEPERAIRTLEKALRNSEAREPLFEQLEDYRASVFPRLVSYASIDQAIEARFAESGEDGTLWHEVRAKFEGEADSRLRAYLHASLVEASGRFADAAPRFRALAEIDESAREPRLGLISSLRGIGQYEDALREIERALAGRFAGDTEFRDLWWLVSVVDLETPLSELAFPDDGEESGYGESVRLLNESLLEDGVFRVNCGGERLVEPSGVVWSKDHFFGSGRTRDFPEAIEGQPDETVYKTVRSFPERGLRSEYRFPVAPGRYRVTLHFIEIEPVNIGPRRFDVVVEGDVVISGFSPMDSGLQTPYEHRFEKIVEDGILDIRFASKIGRAEVAGIELKRLH